MIFPVKFDWDWPSSLEMSNINRQTMDSWYYITLLHSERPKLYGVLDVLSAMVSNYIMNTVCSCELSYSYAMVCLPVRGDNPQALAL